MTATATAFSGWLARARCLSGRTRLAILAALVAAAAIAAILTPPLAQDQAYHDFADRRGALGIANFADVTSNLAFLVVGALGLGWIAGRHGQSLFEASIGAWPWRVFFAAVVLVAAGSVYYHLAPGDARLVWDRLPIAIASGAMLAGFAADRIHLRAGVVLVLPAAVALGAASMWLWSATGDLRLYAAGRALSPMLILAVCLMYPGRATDFRYLAAALASFAAATVLELADKAVFAATGGAIGGHTVKHLLAALAILFVLAMLRRVTPRSGC